MSNNNFIQDIQNSHSPIGKYTSSLFSPNGIILAGCLLGIAAFSIFSGGKKGKLATSYFGGGKETAKAKKKALKQVIAPKCDSATLYIGRHKFKDGRTKGEKGSGGTPLYIPDVQRGTAVIGAPGSGKSFSAINPMIYSAIDQGFPIVLYDFKYPTQAKVASYAKKMGYEVHVFAPGFPESEVCNPLDFLRDATDAETARQLATVINKNFKMMASSNEDAFFGPAGNQLTEAILMLTKGMQYPDIMTAAAILSSDRMVERLMAANLNPWIKISFGQLFSSAGSEKTIAGIAGTASLMFTRFMKKNTLGCFVGKTTLPLEIKGKQMIIFGLDRERRDAVGPLLCSILHMTVARATTSGARNANAKKRKDPLVVVLDEVPSLYLPDLFKWLNESRSEGFCGILGWQNMGQLEKYYGKEVAKTMLGACGTKFIFNPGEEESARLFSAYLGDEEIKYKQKSKSTGGGKTSTSVSDQDKTRKLFEPAQFLKLPPGKCIFINPAYSNKDEASVPLLKAIKVPKALINIEQANDIGWDKLIVELTKKSTQKRPTQEDLDKRVAEVDKLFPIPQQPVQAGAVPLPVDAYKGFL